MSVQAFGSVQTQAPAPDMMKAEDVARSLQISMRTLYRWLSAGTAPAADFRLGKVLRWRRETVDAWIANHGGAQ